MLWTFEANIWLSQPCVTHRGGVICCHLRSARLIVNEYYHIFYHRLMQSLIKGLLTNSVVFLRWQYRKCLEYGLTQFKHF